MQEKHLDSAVSESKEPVWWQTICKATDDSSIAFNHVRATITPADTSFLIQVVQQRNGQELRCATAILREMLRGRFPVVMPQREAIAQEMLRLARDGYPEGERARAALSVLTFADREAASQFTQTVKFVRAPAEYRKEIADQLNAINTEASLAKLDQFLAAQLDPKLRPFRSTRRYVSVEELGSQWQDDHDIAVLNSLSSEWIYHIYEGYPLDEVIAVMGQPQRSGNHFVYYSSKQGPELYLEVNDARQIGGWDGPR